LPRRNHPPVRPPRDAVELAVDVLSDRWTFLILREGYFGVRRYGQMQRNLGIARNVLADRLRQMVDDGLFERVRYRTDPDWYEYRLTDRAIELYPAIVALMSWADRHLRDDDDTDRLQLIHHDCGKPADPYLACSHCHAPITARAVAPTPVRAPDAAEARRQPPRADHARGQARPGSDDVSRAARRPRPPS
jgi:DNA-binding HxlR family transcriptional regulator